MVSLIREVINVFDAFDIRPASAYDFYLVNYSYEEGCVFTFDRVMALTPDSRDCKKIESKQWLLFSIGNRDTVHTSTKYRLSVQGANGQLTKVVTYLIRKLGVFTVLEILEGCNLTDDETEAVRELSMELYDESADILSDKLDIVTKVKILYKCIEKDVGFFGFA